MKHARATARVSAKARSITPLPLVARRRPLILPSRAAQGGPTVSPSLNRGRGGNQRRGKREGSRGAEPPYKHDRKRRATVTITRLDGEGGREESWPNQNTKEREEERESKET